MEKYRGTRNLMYMKTRVYAKMEIAMDYTEIQKWDLYLILHINISSRWINVDLMGEAKLDY